jgi:hypothetical protein
MDFVYVQLLDTISFLFPIDWCSLSIRHRYPARMSESVLSFYDDEVFSADGNAEASSSRRTPSRMGTPNRTGKRNAQTAELPDCQ